jgi:hypothetical protein
LIAEDLNGHGARTIAKTMVASAPARFPLPQALSQGERDMWSALCATFRGNKLPGIGVDPCIHEVVPQQVTADQHEDGGGDDGRMAGPTLDHALEL